jgi:two-component sensor histidine kinase
LVEDPRVLSREAVSVIRFQGHSIHLAHIVESLGLIVTEGVLNALKHAFPEDKKDGRIVIGYKVDGSDWKLTISDKRNGPS